MLLWLFSARCSKNEKEKGNRIWIKKTMTKVGLLAVFLVTSGIVTISIYKKSLVHCMGKYLFVQSLLPANLDVIMSFGGARSTRDRYAQELVKKFPNATWVLSGRNKEAYMKELSKNGVDTVKIDFVDACESTLDEIQYLKKYLVKQKQTATVGLVSNQFHMRRIKLFAEYVIGSDRKTDKNQLQYLPVPSLLEGNWYPNVSSKVVLWEWSKMIAYYPVIVGIYLKNRLWS